MGSGQVTFSSVPFDFQGEHVTVAGLGVSGVPAAKVLHGLGARVTVVNDGDDERARAQAAELEALGVTVRLGDEDTLPDGTELIVTAPGWKPTKPLFTAAGEAGVPVWGDVELAWRLRGRDGRKAAPWLAVTGTNGKTTTVQMLASILKAAGLRTAAVGNIGVSLLDAVTGETEYDVLAVELSSYQLHWAPSLRAHSATVLNLAPDHLDWHGSMEAYAADKGRVYEGNPVACVHNVADKATEDLVREADVEEGCRAIGFTLGTPAPGQLGVVEGILVDRAFVEDRQKNARNSPRSPTSTRRRRTTSPTPLPPPPSAVPSASPPRPYATGCGPSRPTPTASRMWPTSKVWRTWTTPGPPTPTPPRYPWRRTSRSSGSPAGYQGRDLRRAGHGSGEAPARCRPHRRRPRPDPRSPGAIRPRSTRGRPRPDRHWCDAPGRPGGPATRPARRHGAAGPGLCLHGYVHQLQQAR